MAVRGRKSVISVPSCSTCTLLIGKLTITILDVDALELEVAEKEKQEAAKPAAKKGKNAAKKPKTANRLDERFQITPEHDPDHIFDEEKEMINRLREEIEDCRFYSDKWICYFLFARRHNYDAVKELLSKYLQTRRDFGWRTCSPIFTEESLRSDRAFITKKISLIDHLPYLEPQDSCTGRAASLTKKAEWFCGYSSEERVRMVENFKI
jgi:hypothetical protein